MFQWRPFKGGHIASGILRFSKKDLSFFDRKLEYKYILKKRDEPEYFPEFLGAKNKNRILYFDYFQMNIGNIFSFFSYTWI